MTKKEIIYCYNVVKLHGALNFDEFETLITKFYEENRRMKNRKNLIKKHIYFVQKNIS